MKPFFISRIFFFKIFFYLVLKIIGMRDSNLDLLIKGSQTISLNYNIFCMLI